jgi:hypothetical protein
METDMKLWLISQTENDGYDTYDSAVVAAETETEATRIAPGAYAEPWPQWENETYSPWASTADKVTAKLIGEAAEGVTGIVCASFNAG